MSAPRIGRVSLVGAGPGNPDLLTLRAADRLAHADVVFCDALVGPEILSLCRADARVVPVGKRRGCTTLSQRRIERAMTREARAGRRVVRLKGGDAFVFGRGGEEALAMATQGVPVEVIPGLTSGTSVPAAAGIPVTHRGLSRAVAFVTAHDLDEIGGARDTRRRLSHLARGADTIVVFMAGAHADRVASSLLRAGLPGNMPAAVIENGTRPDQIVDTTSLAVLAKSRPSRRAGPVLIVVGRTVGLAATIREAGRDQSAPASIAHSGERTNPAAPAKPAPSGMEERNEPERRVHTSR